MRLGQEEGKRREKGINQSVGGRTQRKQVQYIKHRERSKNEENGRIKLGHEQQKRLGKETKQKKEVPEANEKRARSVKKNMKQIKDINKGEEQDTPKSSIENNDKKDYWSEFRKKRKEITPSEEQDNITKRRIEDKSTEKRVWVDFRKRSKDKESSYKKQWRG